jgi:hypothetical protein
MKGVLKMGALSPHRASWSESGLVTTQSIHGETPHKAKRPAPVRLRGSSSGIARAITSKFERKRFANWHILGQPLHLCTSNARLPSSSCLESLDALTP